MLEELLLQSNQIIDNTEVKFLRYLHRQINWDNRLIAIKGARGSGKTTLILQHIALNHKINSSVLYISLEDLYFLENTLLSLADEFVLNGGQYLFLDEVHKYPDWAREIKLMYDKHKKLKVVFTSSSVSEINKAKFDLSRRAVEYSLKELSLREYIELESGIKLPSYNFKELLTNHTEITKKITEKIKVIFWFNKYVKKGAYPYIIESEKDYAQKLKNTINVILENDLPAVYKIDFALIYKLKKLLYAVATSVPFKPNISKLSEKIGISRPTLLLFLNYLEKSELIYQLFPKKTGISSMTKPEKIYLHNTNLSDVISKQNFNVGNIRETFFINQVSTEETINYSAVTDFIVNGKYSFEIGGRNKQQKQIKNLKNAYIVKDNIERGMENIIPLWLFGFLY